jgi:predicted phage terminase large subunit-like protein
MTALSPEAAADLQAKLAKLPRKDLERAVAIATELNRRRVLAECQTFAGFVRHAWQHVETAALIWEPHFDIVCAEMQAFHERRIKRLIFNIPPGTAKSLLVSVLFPAWVWTQTPQHRFLCLSAGEDVAIRDSVRCRRLITGEWYQSLWGRTVQLTSDVNTKTNFENSKGGFRDCDTIRATVTGRRGDTILIDDPHDAERIKSDPERIAVLDAFDGKLSTRLNSMDDGGICLIMQRLHESDLTGHIMKTMGEEEWEHVILPMEYDGPRWVSRIGLKDWRTKPGEILTPKRISAKALRILKVRLKAYGTAGQLQQSPAPREGGILPRSAWRVWVGKKLPVVESVLLSFDTSQKDAADNDPSAFCALGVFEFEETDDRFLTVPGRSEMKRGVMVLRAWAAHLRFGDLKRAFMEEYERYTVEGEPPDECMIEDKASGPTLLQELADQGIRVFGYNPGRDGKVTRATFCQEIFDEGLVWAPGRMKLGAEERSRDEFAKGVEDLVQQCAMFPNGDHDDMVDTVVQGLRRLRDRGDIIVGADLPPPEDDGRDDWPVDDTGSLVSAYGHDG